MLDSGDEQPASPGVAEVAHGVSAEQIFVAIVLAGLSYVAGSIPFGIVVPG